MSSSANRALVRLFALTAIVAFHFAAARASSAPAADVDIPDAALVKLLPGFENGYAEVNGTRLHYVIRAIASLRRPSSA